MSSSLKIKQAKIKESIPPFDEAIEVSTRDAQPAHCILKIKSFSLLSQSGIEKYESVDFASGGYKWRICLYPNGNKKRNVDNHISLYLAISDEENLPQGWEANVHFKFFVYDHLRDNYLTIQEAGDKIRRFRWMMKTEWGFDKLISLDLFNNTSNGYLFEDSCQFGAEVFVNNYERVIQCLEMKKETGYINYTWKTENFSTVSKEVLKSDYFEVEKLKWRLVLYPKGEGEYEGKYLQLGLQVRHDATRPLQWKVYVKFKLRIRDQAYGNHNEVEGGEWLGSSDDGIYYPKFLLLSDLNDSRRFKVNDTLIFEAEIKVISMMKNLT